MKPIDNYDFFQKKEENVERWNFLFILCEYCINTLSIWQRRILFFILLILEIPRFLEIVIAI